MSSGVGRMTRLDAGGGTGGKKLRGDPQTGDAEAPTTLLTAPQRCLDGCYQDGESEPAFGEMVTTATWIDHEPGCPNIPPTPENQ